MVLLALSEGPMCSFFRKTNNELRDPRSWAFDPGCYDFFLKPEITTLFFGRVEWEGCK